MNAYPETIVTPGVPNLPPPVTPPVEAPPVPEPVPEPPVIQGGGSTQDISRPTAPTSPPGGQSTIVMSSTPVAEPPKQAKLLLIMEGGEVGEMFSLRPSGTTIGRIDGDIKFPDDGYMSSRHARILKRNGRFFLGSPAGSLTKGKTKPRCEKEIAAS
jgi:hypothetical protein